MLRFREDAEALRGWWGCWGPRSWNNSPVVTQPIKWQRQDLSWGLSYSNLLLIADYTASFLENSTWLAPIPALEGVGNPSPLIFICGTGSSAVPSGQGCQKGCRHWTCQNMPLCPPAGLPKALSSSCQRQGGECQAGEGPGWAVTASVLQKRCPSLDLSLQLLVRSHANASFTLERSQTLESTVVWWWFSSSVLSNSCNPIPWTLAHQAPLSMAFPRQEYWSVVPFPSLGDLPDPGIECASPVLQADSLPMSHQGRISRAVFSFWMCLSYLFTFPELLFSSLKLR